MSEPSVKGILLQQVVDRLQHHLESGTIDRDALEARLEKSDLDLLDKKIVPVVWYPIRSYARLVELADALEGGLSDQDHVHGGEADARRMMQAGVYSQLELFERMEKVAAGAPFDERFQALGRTLRLAISISRAIFNFTEWKVVPDPDHPRRYRVEVTDAALLPRSNTIGAVGFLNECCRSADPRDPISWSVERPAPDRVLYRMDRDYA